MGGEAGRRMSTTFWRCLRASVCVCVYLCLSVAWCADSSWGIPFIVFDIVTETRRRAVVHSVRHTHTHAHTCMGIFAAFACEWILEKNIWETLIRHNKINMMSATLKLRSIKDVHTHMHTHTGRQAHIRLVMCVVKMLLLSLCLSSVQNGRRKAERKSEGSRQSTVRHYAHALPGCVLDKLAAPSSSLSLSLQTILENQHKVQKWKLYIKTELCIFFYNFCLEVERKVLRAVVKLMRPLRLQERVI